MSLLLSLFGSVASSIHANCACVVCGALVRLGWPKQHCGHTLVCVPCFDCMCMSTGSECKHDTNCVPVTFCGNIRPSTTMSTKPSARARDLSVIIMLTMCFCNSLISLMRALKQRKSYSTNARARAPSATSLPGIVCTSSVVFVGNATHQSIHQPAWCYVLCGYIITTTNEHRRRPRITGMEQIKQRICHEFKVVCVARARVVSSICASPKRTAPRVLARTRAAIVDSYEKTDRRISVHAHTKAKYACPADGKEKEFPHV